MSDPYDHPKMDRRQGCCPMCGKFVGPGKGKVCWNGGERNGTWMCGDCLVVVCQECQDNVPGLRKKAKDVCLICSHPDFDIEAARRLLFMRC